MPRYSVDLDVTYIPIKDRESSLAEINTLLLTLKAQNEFNANCKANIVSLSQLYEGKIAAALSRQHPRDLFDYKYMETDNFDAVGTARNTSIG